MKPEELEKFIGRTKPFAEQTKNGGYIPIHYTIREDDLKKHLEGKETLGTYVIREDGLINFAVIDIDGKEGEDMGPYKRLAQNIMPLFLEFERVLEFSGRRGYHIWIFPENPEPPRFMRELIKSRLKRKGLRNIEVYPKQDKVDVLEKKLGNLMKLPCGKHLKGGWSKIIEWKKAGE